MDEYHLLDRLENLAIKLGLERAARENAEVKAEAVRMTMEANKASFGGVVSLLEFIATDRKLEAIKEYRQLTGVGLKDSKDAVERVMSRFGEPAKTAA